MYVKIVINSVCFSTHSVVVEYVLIECVNKFNDSRRKKNIFDLSITKSNYVFIFLLNNREIYSRCQRFV